MQPQNDHRRWLLRPDVVSTVLNDGAVILDLRSKYFFSANSTGWAIAQMFETGATRVEILEAGRRWGADAAEVQAINAVIDQMIHEGLVEPANGSATTPGDVPLTVWISPTLTKHREPLQRVMTSAFDPGLPLAE